MRRRLALLAAAVLVSVFLPSGVASQTAQPNASASPQLNPKRMVARIWHGRTPTAKANEYEKYLDASGIARILKTRGNHGVEVLRRTDGPRTDFIVISYWESLDAVKRFAGKEYRRAVILDRDREFLIDVEPEVAHYEVVRAAGN